MIWYIAAGGAVGSVLRFLVGLLIQDRVGTAFPAGTLLVNITGSFLLGLLIEYALATPAISREVRAMLTTGFCGGYTTFSTFSYETARLMQDGDYRRAGTYVALSVVVSVAGTFAGFAVARELLALRRGA
jgi:fluoride exporter